MIARELTPSALVDSREALNLSQAALAKILGRDVMTVSRWERGQSGIPPDLWLTLRAIEHRLHLLR